MPVCSEWHRQRSASVHSGVACAHVVKVTAVSYMLQSVHMLQSVLVPSCTKYLRLGIVTAWCRRAESKRQNQGATAGIARCAQRCRRASRRRSRRSSMTTKTASFAAHYSPMQCRRASARVAPVLSRQRPKWQTVPAGWAQYLPRSIAARARTSRPSGSLSTRGVGTVTAPLRSHCSSSAAVSTIVQLQVRPPRPAGHIPVNLRGVPGYARITRTDDAAGRRPHMNYYSIIAIMHAAAAKFKNKIVPGTLFLPSPAPENIFRPSECGRFWL